MPEPQRPIPAEDMQLVFQGLEHLWPLLLGQRIFITGGTGFVGKWLVGALLDADSRLGLGLHLTLLSRDPERFRVSHPALADSAAVELIGGDVTRFDYPAQRIDMVIHAAADVVAQVSPLQTFDTCITGTRRTLDLAVAHGCKRFLLLSSGAVYGRQPDDIERIPETHVGAPDPAAAGSAYGLGKLGAEWLTHTYAREHGLNVSVARCFAFTGPYLPLDKQFAIGNFIGDALAGKPLLIKGDGTPYRSYLYATDMVIWLITLLLQSEPGDVLNVGGDEAVSIGELAALVVATLGSHSGVEIAHRPDPSRPPARYLPDIGKAGARFGLRPTIGLETAIRRTADWHTG